MSLFSSRQQLVTLQKVDGTTLSIKAEIQDKLIFIEDTNTPVEVDDVIQRKRSNGIIDRYIITNVDIHEGGHLAHIELRYINEKQINRTSFGSIHNITADKVYIQSTDNSSSIITTIGNAEESKFNELLEVVSALSKDASIMKELVLEMRLTAHTPEFTDKYKEFMANAANHITVLAPFMPWLASLIK